MFGSAEKNKIFSEKGFGTLYKRKGVCYNKTIFKSGTEMPTRQNADSISAAVFSRGAESMKIFAVLGVGARAVFLFFGEESHGGTYHYGCERNEADADKTGARNCRAGRKSRNGGVCRHSARRRNRGEAHTGLFFRSGGDHSSLRRNRYRHAARRSGLRFFCTRTYRLRAGFFRRG